jgi:DNA-binding FadR family transcriptional regulator
MASEQGGAFIRNIAEAPWREFPNHFGGAVKTCREFDAQEIFDLYELRKSIEIAAIRLAIKRARVR